MAESNLVGPMWLEAVMVETRRVREEGNWVCLEDANVKVDKKLQEKDRKWTTLAKEGVSKGRGELERFRTELVPEL
ncbi:hypothetical protein CFP56_018409, partial [Quercus suber]